MTFSGAGEFKLDDVKRRKILAGRLRSARLLMGIRRQSEFARRIGTSPTTYQRWESGDYLPDLLEFYKICKFTKLDPTYFFQDLTSYYKDDIFS
jgi:transcriptional regulator with XRE-family HTH domain